MRAATFNGIAHITIKNYFNPRSPCGLRHVIKQQRAAVAEFQSTQPMRAATRLRVVLRISLSISIHAAHAGCDIYLSLFRKVDYNFNPRSPCGLRPEAERA